MTEKEVRDVDFASARNPWGSMRENARVSVIDLLSVVFRHQKKVLAVFVLGCAGVITTVSMVPDMYRSEAKILMRGVRGSLSLDPSQDGVVSGEYRPLTKDRTMNELEILQSTHLAEIVLNKMGAEAILNTPDNDTALAASLENLGEEEESLRHAALKAIMNGLDSEIEGNVIKLSYLANSPTVAHGVLDGLVQNYLQRHIEIYSSPASPEFFENEAAAILTDLQAKQKELEILRAKNGLGDVQAQKDAAYRQQSELQASVSQIRVEIQATIATIASFELSLNARDRSVEVARSQAENERARQLNDKLLELRLEEQYLALRYLDDNRELQGVRANIGLIEERLAKEPEFNTEVTMALDSTRQSLEGEYARERAKLGAAHAAEAALEQEIVKSDAWVKFLVTQAPTIMRLQGEVEQLEEDYQIFQESRSRARIDAALDRDHVTNVSIIQEATVPFEPESAQRLRNIVLGVFLSLSAGIGLAFLADQFDDSMKTSAEVEKKLKLPVLATVAFEKIA